MFTVYQILWRPLDIQSWIKHSSFLKEVQAIAGMTPWRYRLKAKAKLLHSGYLDGAVAYYMSLFCIMHVWIRLQI